MRPLVETFRETLTSTVSSVVYDTPHGQAAIIGPVLDYNGSSGRAVTTLAERPQAFVSQHELKVEWILETHAHADSLSAGGYPRDQLSARLAIGRNGRAGNQSVTGLTHINVPRRARVYNSILQ